MDFLGESESVHDRHTDVSHYEMDVITFQAFESLRTVRGLGGYFKPCVQSIDVPGKGLHQKPFVLYQ